MGDMVEARFPVPDLVAGAGRQDDDNQPVMPVERSDRLRDHIVGLRSVDGNDPEQSMTGPNGPWVSDFFPMAYTFSFRANASSIV